MKPKLVACVALVVVLCACAAPTSDRPQASDSASDATGGPSSTTDDTGPSSTTDGVASPGSTAAGVGGGVGNADTTSSAATTTAAGETTASTSSGGTTSSTGGATASTSSGAPNGASLPFLEDFEDGVADGFIDGVDNEQQPLGSWMVVDDESKVYQEQTATSDPSWAVGGDYRWTDQLLAVRMKVVSGIEDFVGIIAVRFSSFDGYAFLEIQSDQIKLRLRNQGSTTDLSVYKFETDLTEGSWHSYALGVSGSDYTLYFDEQAVGTASNAELTAGGIALGATDAVIAFDDLSVSVPE